MHDKEKYSICFCYEMNCGGETAATEAIIKELRESPDIRILSHSHSPLIHTDFIRFFFWIFRSIFFWIWIIYKNRQVDWIYTTTFTAGVAAALVKPFGSYKIAWHFHGNRIPPSPKEYKGKTYITQVIKQWAVQKLHELFLRNTDLIFVPTVQSKRWLIGTIPYTHRSAICIIPNGVDLQRFHPLSPVLRQRLRKKYKVHDSTHVFLSVGRIEKHKGLALGIQTAALVVAKNENMRWIIIHPHITNDPEQKYKAYLERAIDAKRLKQKVVWIQDPDRIEEYYHIADVTLSFSQFEFFPLTMLESFACGTLYIGHAAGNVGPFVSQIDRRLLLTSRNPRTIAKHLQALCLLPRKEKQKIQRKGRDLVLYYSWNQTVRIMQKYLTDSPV